MEYEREGYSNGHWERSWEGLKKVLLSLISQAKRTNHALLVIALELVSAFKISMSGIGPSPNQSRELSNHDAYITMKDLGLWCA